MAFANLTTNNENGNSKKKKVDYTVVQDLGKVTDTKAYSQFDRKMHDAELRLRIVQFGKGDPAYDLRPWYKDEDGDEIMGKGIRLSGDELNALKDFLIKADKQPAKKSTRAKKAS